MHDWAVCTIGTTARLEIDRFEKACAFEPYGSECPLIPTIRRDLAAAKTATPVGWPHLRIGNLLSEHFPCTFCIVANDRSVHCTRRNSVSSFDCRSEMKQKVGFPLWWGWTHIPLYFRKTIHRWLQRKE
jgi:hypothetical protein